MQRVTCAALLIVATGAIAGWSSPATAQIAGPRQRRSSYGYRPFTYQPARPAFSPYLQLSRREQGQILPSYQTFVQPRVQARQFQRQQTANVQQLQRSLHQVQQSQGQIQELGNIPTGVGAGFRNGGAFYRTSGQFFQTHRPRR